MCRGLQMWAALEREVDWRRAAPCRESEPGVSPPRLQHQPVAATSLLSLRHPSLLVIYFFLRGEGWWRQMVFSTPLL
jgi:hypothetical protein